MRVSCWYGKREPKAHDAHRALHVYRGWEEYKPMLREDGTPIPEDEDDDFQEVDVSE